MGGSPQQQQQTQAQTVTQPWAPTQGALQGILGQINGQMGNTTPTATENNAFGQLTANAQAGNPYAGQIGNVANNLLSGGGANNYAAPTQAAYDQYSQQVMPWANGSMGDPSQNPALRSMLDTIRSDTSNQINGQFAAAGRDMSGLNQQALARGIAQGEAPTLLNAQTQGLNTAQNLYSAGNSTQGILAGLNQTSLGNQQAGVGQATNALAAQNYAPNQLLQIAGAQRQLPLSNIANLNSLLLPIAGLGGQSDSTSNTTSQTNIPAWQQMLGGGAAAAGILGKTGAFGSGGWLGPALSSGGSALAGGAAAGGEALSSLLPLLALSDRRLKSNIERIGELPNGLPVYSFNYLWSDAPMVGLMADEVEKLHPRAVHTVGGFKAVDYAMAVT